MAINYPTSLDNFTNPTGSDALNSGSVPHATQHANVNDAVKALEAKVGVNPSGPTVLTGRGSLDSLIRDGGVNVKAFGAVGDGVTDDTAAISAALTAASAAQGGLVFFPIGTFITSPFAIPDGVWLFGRGFGTIIKQKSASNSNAFITNSTDATMCGIYNLRVDGNQSGQSSGNGHGIQFNTSGAQGGRRFVDARQHLSNVHVENCRGDGVQLLNRGVCKVTDCSFWNNSGNGITCGTDNQITNCEAGANGLSGFVVDGSVTNLVNCNAFFSGAVDVSKGWGFYITGNRCGLTNCTAQDNRRSGFYLKSCYNTVLSSCVSDRNGLTASYATEAGFELDGASYCNVQGTVSSDAGNPGWSTAYAVKLSGSFSYPCRVTVVGNGNTGFINDPSGSLYGGTVVTSNIGDAYSVATFAASYTPNPANGNIQQFTLTGNITINNPSSETVGTRLTFIFLQDGTGGRTVTWGSHYKTGGWTPNTGANKYNSISYVFDGSYWVAISSLVNV